VGACSDLLDACDALGRLAGELGVGLLQAEDGALDGRHVRIAGRPRLNFSSCSYLGLELDVRLIAGACDAARRFGTQFSASRAFLSAPPYAELEERLGEITGGPTLVTANTTLASAAALPSLVRESDVVILDHQVHVTVQLVVPTLQRTGAAVEMVRHGHLERLEERIRALRERHRRIWLLLDGVYSMHGDLAPMGALAVLLARYEQLHLYVDDAHGMSWMGRSGRGWALDRLPDRSRVIVALSLNKAFGAGGGALVFPDEATRRFVRHTAPPLIFSGPLQPPTLGAALASARIHLSKEIARLQEDLRARIRHANRRAAELGLPLLGGDALVPIRFVGLGPQAASTAMATHLMERGLLPSCALFPAVPGHQTGIRFTLTRHHRPADIDRLLDEMAEFLPEALSRGGVRREDLDRAFGLGARAEAPMAAAPARRRGRAAARPPGRAALRCEHRTSVAEVDRAEWDGLLGSRGSFDWEGLRWLEETFGAHQKPESRWRFHYLHVRDASGRPVLATFFSEAWMKDEMLAGAAVSREVERRRREEPAFLTSRVLTMGSPLTEGDHLHLVRDGAPWRDALELLVAQISRIADESDVRLVALRDLPADDAELGSALRELGFARMRAPDSMVLDLDWTTPQEHLARLSKRARRHQRREVAPWDGAYRVQVLPSEAAPSPPGALWAHLYGLYRAVWQRSTDLVTFALPEDFLPRMLAHPGFEIVTLTLRPERGGESGAPPDAFFAARIGREGYVPLVVGLDDRRVRGQGVYRQCLASMVQRARELGARRLLLGMGAALEKQRFGARAERRSIWLQTRDDFSARVLGLLGGEANLHARRPDASGSACTKDGR
jgi:7-keto-8-aminopelargonate synthetase-like enzyme